MTTHRRAKAAPVPATLNAAPGDIPPAERVHVGPDRSVAEFASEFAEALRAGSRARAEQVTNEAVSAGISPEAIHALIIEPALVLIGELWESGAISVADEHLVTAISERVLSGLLGALTTAAARSRERVVLAAVSGQHHVLGLRMVADVLDGAGYDVMFLGGDVPLDALRGFVAEYQPAVTGLSCTLATGVSDLWQAIRAVHDASAEPRIMLGGAAIPPGLRNRPYPFVHSSLEVIATVQALLGAEPQAAAARTTPPRRMSGDVPAGSRDAPSRTVLTPRELQVLQLSARGRARRQIADELTLSEGTVKTHFEHIYKKLGVHDRASAVGYALREGMIR